MLRLYEFDTQEEKIASSVFNECLNEYDIKAYEIDVDITMVSGEEIRELNRDNRDVDKVTDVLSFPFVDVTLPFHKADYLDDINPESGAVYLGEIMICREVMAEQAREYGHSVIRECAYLITHGMHHLLGYDHIEESDKVIMRAQEEKILERLNYLRISASAEEEDV